MDEVLRIVAAPGDPPDALDDSKKGAWEAIAAGRSINVVVGPPGVGKTYLVARLIGSILVRTPSARILVSSQNHETLISMEHELKEVLTPLRKIVVARAKVRRRDGRDAPEADLAGVPGGGVARRHVRAARQSVSRDPGGVATDR